MKNDKYLSMANFVEVMPLLVDFSVLDAFNNWARGPDGALAAGAAFVRRPSPTGIV